MDKLSKQRFQRFVLVIVSLIVILLMITYLSGFIYPFILAFLFSMLLHPIVSILENKWNINRGIATFIVIINFFFFITICSYFIIRRLLLELTELGSKLPNYVSNLSHLLNQLEAEYLPIVYRFFQNMLPLKKENEQQLSSFIVEKFKDFSTSLIDQSVIFISDSLTSFAYTFLVLFFIVLATYFMTKDYPIIIKLFKRLIPFRIKQFSLKISHFAKQSIIALIKAQLMIAILTATMSFTGLIIFQVEHVLVLTITLFFVDLIPYIGIGIIYLPWIVYSFLQEQYIFTVQLSLLYVVIIIVRQIIEPRLLAKNLGIHPLVTIMILFISIQLFGPFGVFLTPIILIVISSLYHAKIIQVLSKYIKEGFI